MNVCITGGCGYIGSNVAALCLAQGWSVLILDDLSNSSAARIGAVSSFAKESRLHFEQVDILDVERVRSELKKHRTAAIVHCAGRKSVRESWLDPLGYWRVNVDGTRSVLEAAMNTEVRRLLFSSSATVYRASDIPVNESCDLGPQNPYGNTKLACEKLLQDAASKVGIQALAFRYFNPIGDGVGGQLPDSPLSRPENLFPILMEAVFSGAAVTVNGGDYPTRDGSAVRDYINVVDIAQAHVAALKSSLADDFLAVNLGSGTGTTVLKSIASLSRHARRDLHFSIGGRRDGDSPISLADSSLARRLWGWTAKVSVDATIESMIAQRISNGR